MKANRHKAIWMFLLCIHYIMSSEWIMAEGSTNAPPIDPPYNNVYVLSIGIDKYPGGWATLQNAEKDANDLCAVLSKRYNFKATALTHTNATKPNITAAIANISRQITEKDDLIITWSGHGQTARLSTNSNEFSRTGFLIPYDPALSPKDGLEQLRKRGIEMSVFAAQLTQMRARHRLMILDACFSGFATSIASVTNKISDDQIQELLKHPTVQVITSGTETETAPDQAIDEKDKKVNNGLLTYALMREFNQERIITGDEWYFSVRSYVRNSAAKQNLTLNPQRRYLISSCGDFVFVPTAMSPKWTNTKDNNVSSDFMTRGYSEPVTDAEVADISAKSKTKGAKENDPVYTNQLARMEARASVGDANAMAALVTMYGVGMGTKPDNSQSLLWAREGYDTGTPAGKIAMGTALLNGYGIAANKNAALSLYGSAGTNAMAALGINDPDVINAVGTTLGLIGATRAVGSPTAASVGSTVGSIGSIGSAISGMGGMFGSSNPFKKMSNHVDDMRKALKNKKIASLEKNLPKWSEEFNKTDLAKIPAEANSNFLAIQSELKNMQQNLQQGATIDTLEQSVNVMQAELDKLPAKALK